MSEQQEPEQIESMRKLGSDILRDTARDFLIMDDKIQSERISESIKSWESSKAESTSPNKFVFKKESTTEHPFFITEQVEFWTEPIRKYPLTAEQQRVVDTLADYERAYITCNQKDGNYLVLNGDKAERVRSNTVTALIKKGWIRRNGMTGYKLI